MSPKKIHTKLRFDFLDGIRGWASVMVLLSHTIVCFLAKTTPSYQTPYFAFITDGHLAVFIFFVLSGFALSIKFIHQSECLIAPAVTSRYFRLFIPIFFTSFIAYLFMKQNLMFNIQAGEIAHSPDWLGTFFNFSPTLEGLLRFCTYNVFFDYQATSTYNPVLWTMPIEYTGSMLIYFVIAVFRKPHQTISLIPLSIITIYFLKHSPAIACFMLGYFLGEIHFLYRDIKANLLRMIATFLFIAPIVISTFFRPDEDIYTALLAFTLVLSVTFSPIIQKLFEHPISKFLGKISFPLYLVHIIIICSLSSYLFLNLPPFGFEHQQMANIILLTTISVSILFAWAISPIESLSLKLSKYLSSKILALSFSQRATIELPPPVLANSSHALKANPLKW